MQYCLKIFPDIFILKSYDFIMLKGISSIFVIDPFINVNEYLLSTLALNRI